MIYDIEDASGDSPPPPASCNLGPDNRHEFDCSPEFNLNTSWTESDKIEYHLIQSTLYAR